MPYFCRVESNEAETKKTTTMNYPIFFRRMKSNNYTVATTDADLIVRNESELTAFFARVSSEKSTTYSRSMRGLKTAQVLRSGYSKSNAYYRDAAHFIKSNSK
jgi:IS1 family transposase